MDDDDVEIRNNFTKTELLGVAKAFIEENCNKDGTLKNKNISKQNENGIKSLRNKSD